MQNSSPIRALQSEVSSDAQRILSLTRTILKAEPVKSNVILPVLVKRAREQGQGRNLSDHLWIVIYTGDYEDPRIVLIASCTDGYMGKYPIFLFTPVPYGEMRQPQHLVSPALRMMITKLYEWGQYYYNDQRRIYSVFGQKILAEQFADLWTGYTGIQKIDEPYCRAKISYATLDRVAQCYTAMPPRPNERIQIKPAGEDDVEGVKKLCYRFALESPPFTLNEGQAFQEADILIKNGEVWVYYVQQGHSGRRRLASIVAFTRNTPDMATITKVYTHHEFRRQGRAEHLVREVCKYLLSAEGGKRLVCLFVGIDNIMARKVFSRVGFVGLVPNSPPIEGIDPWVEIGFDRGQVDLGHW